MKIRHFPFRKNVVVMTAAAFAFAAAFSFLMALFVGSALEGRSERHVKRALTAAGLHWAEVSADGLLVTLSGTAPAEATRFRAATIAGRTVGASRINDIMDVIPARALTAPRFSLELLRNDDGISVIGLVPTAWDSDGFLGSARALATDHLTNMVETADFPVPDGWEDALRFAEIALKLLPRSKISVAADGVQVTAISDSPAMKRQLETDLGRAYPTRVPVTVNISAPRPVIAPFTFRMVKDAEGARFDACSADSQRARSRIQAAAARAGVTGTPACTLGLGAPSPRWAEAAEAVMAAMTDLEGGTATISDVDVTLIADHSVMQTDFDRIIGELTAKLPDVFSLKATLTPRPQADGVQGPAQFIATLSPEGQVQLRGRLSDERMRDVVEAFARARFGAGNIYTAARLDDSLPPGWSTRVLAALGALAELNNGSVLVEPEQVAIRGVTGNEGARAEITRLLSDRLGQGSGFAVDIRYDERLDPARGLPTPQECLAQANSLLESRQITFAPNAVAIEGEASAIVQALADILANCGEARLEIGGHTDSQGRAETNLRLSQQRAEAVLTALAERGIDTSLHSARGYGAAEPIADNATEEGRVANRRIAFRLLPATPETTADDAGSEQPDTAVLPPPPVRPEDLIPLEPEGDEPMGDAGDLEITDGEAPEDEAAPAEPEPVVSSASAAEAPEEAPLAAAPQPEPAPAQDGVTPVETPAADAQAAPSEAPEEPPADWQDAPDHNTMRPVRRPQEFAE